MTDRPYTTGLFMLRCFEMGLSINDLHYLDEGQVIDMIIERGNDNCEYADIATQKDFDRF